jgi:iron uptake system component EfeO
MTRAAFRTLPAALAAGLLTAFAACGSNEDPPAGAKMAFELTDAGCSPHDASVAAGPIQFKIENGGTAKVTEMEIMEGDKVLGERENITEGLSTDFTLTLEKGRYTIYCPGGSDERGTLTVTGEALGRQ